MTGRIKLARSNSERISRARAKKAKRGLYANIQAKRKRKRIAKGSGAKMREPEESGGICSQSESQQVGSDSNFPRRRSQSASLMKIMELQWQIQISPST